MAHKSKWLVDEHIIFNKMDGEVTPDDIRAVVEDNIPMMDNESEAKLIHIIYDMRETTLKGDVVAFQKASRAMFTHGRMGWLLVINSSENRIVNMMASMVSKIFSAQFRQFTSLEDGLKFLNTMDISLPDLSQIEGVEMD